MSIGARSAAAVENPSAGDAAGRADDLQDRARGDALAAAALADDAERPAASSVKPTSPTACRMRRGRAGRRCAGRAPPAAARRAPALGVGVSGHADRPRRAARRRRNSTPAPRSPPPRRAAAATAPSRQRCTFCASCSSTPQLTAGGCSPRPRKDSEVSARIIIGIASVTDGDDVAGQRRQDVAEDHARPAAPVEPGGGDETLRAQREEPPAHLARQLVQPISEMISVMKK